MEFLEVCSRKKTALLELGVGYNTPTTIRFPFEQFVIQNRNASLIRVNMNDGQTTLPLADNYTLSLNGEGMVVITSYSIHYTKLYEKPAMLM